jgi:hypothetical protein
MASHGHFHRLQARVPEPVAEPATLVSVVYVTAAPTFDGPIGGYTTVGVAAADDEPATSPPAVLAAPSSKPPAPVVVPATSEAPAQDPTPTPTPAKQTPTAAAIKPSSTAPAIEVENKSAASSTAVVHTSSALPSEIIAPKTTLASSAPLLAATSSLTFSTPSSSNTASAASSTSTSNASSGGGMSGGALAGVGIGALLLVGAILSILLVCFRKRKNADKQRLADDEKTDNPFADPVRQSDASIRSSPTAPRLSLRPVTQFIPNLMERRTSRGNALNTASALPLTEKALPDLRPETSHSNHTANPFGNHAETIDSANANGPVVMTSPVFENATLPSPVTSIHGPQAVAAPVVGAAVTSAAAATHPGLKRGASKRENGPKPLDFTKSGPFMGPPSPAGTEFSVNSESATSPTQSKTSAAIAAAGGPPNSAVHRVQLDFKPSMDDELELRQGQLIRILQEFDDGWAMCIRLDRAQQGVVPRTCLSTRPVKPRQPQNGPRGSPQGRPMAPGMKPQGPPMSPAGIRPMAPNGQQARPMIPISQQARPMTPTGQQGRPMTPNGQQARPMTPTGQQGRPMTPTGQQGRPMTPNGQQGRPMTPNSQNRPRGQTNPTMNGQGRPRAPSNAPQQARRNSPPGPRQMNPIVPFDSNSAGPLRTPSGNAPQRKPVPGQAM